jgi:hypothetical protein
MRLVGGVMFGLILVSILVELVRLLSTLRILLPLVSITKSKKKSHGAVSPGQSARNGHVRSFCQMGHAPALLRCSHRISLAF